MPTNTQQTVTRGGLEFVKSNKIRSWISVRINELILGWIYIESEGILYEHENTERLLTASDLRTIADFMDELNAQQTAGEAG